MDLRRFHGYALEDCVTVAFVELNKLFFIKPRCV